MDKRKGKRLLKEAYKMWQSAMTGTGDYWMREGSVYICDCIDYACDNLGEEYRKAYCEFTQYIRGRIKGAFSVQQLIAGDCSGKVGECYPSWDDPRVMEMRLTLWKELFALVGETTWSP